MLSPPPYHMSLVASLIPTIYDPCITTNTQDRPIISDRPHLENIKILKTKSQHEVVI
jgi:hypothetical protein